MTSIFEGSSFIGALAIATWDDTGNCYRNGDWLVEGTLIFEEYLASHHKHNWLAHPLLLTRDRNNSPEMRTGKSDSNILYVPALNHQNK